MKHHEAVLFDMDGTLLDTLEDLADSMNEVLAARGFPAHPPAAYKQFVGLGIVRMIEQALPAAAGDDELLQACLDEMNRVYAERWACKTRLYPGIAATLSGLAKRKVPMAIFSNKPHEFTTVMAKHFLADWHFAAVLGARAGYPRKPDPAVALEISGRLAVPPDRFLYVGDTGTDMATARAAGMTAVGVLWGFRDEAELTAGGAQAIIRAPGELPALL